MYVSNIHMDANNIQFTRIEMQIAKYLFKHYKESYNARQLARVMGLNHAHVNKLCNVLVEKKLAVKKDIGNAVYFSYAYNNPLAIKFMEYMLSLDEKEMPRWLRVVHHSLKKFENLIEMGLIFGSSIKTQDFNDIDVLLMYPIAKSKEISAIKEEIRKSELIDKPIRYVDITQKDITANKEDVIFYNILSESLVFYNPEKYVEVIRKCRK